MKVINMSDENLNLNEQISALADGQLSGDALVQAMQSLAHDEQARANWHAYHLVGDVLRSQELSWGCTKDSAFLSRFRSRLEDDDLHFSHETECAMDSIAVYAGNESVIGINDHKKEAANDSGLRWKWVVGLASLALATVLGWGFVDGVNAPVSPSQLAQAPLPVVVVQDESSQVMIRDPRLDPLLQAHQQFGGASALQMPSGFVRNATFERSNR